ncbi:ABC transporter ATP-binding protein [Spiroplasma cantharicola]|uniref:ABC transporter ATP-binding protein n=1 Tax=Spiroplasma cantharicola TaxID=362837 RepID=A0A0M4JS55_9MOLU|nr:ABC transporter ATP-binding protein [Spiroplasma cantharicola]ALD66322.1 ABC transporter ATP-binding protein [Spiroplasma cantharicola]
MIEIKNLTKIFKNGIGLHDINIKLNSGEITAILGPNGAGKSTLLKLIFREYKKDSGEIIYNIGNEDLKKFSFFTDHSLFPKNVSLNYFCMYNAQLSGIKSKDAKKRLEHLLKILDLEKYKNKSFKSLSAGMQKRAMLAATLINDPEFIFFDEPTANLDINSRKELINLIKNMKDKNKTIVITSHILDELQNIIDRVIIIDSGKIVLDKKYDKNKENLETLYFSIIKGQDESKSFDKLLEWNN